MITAVMTRATDDLTGATDDLMLHLPQSLMLSRCLVVQAKMKLATQMLPLAHPPQSWHLSLQPCSRGSRRTRGSRRCC